MKQRSGVQSSVLTAARGSRLEARTAGVVSKSSVIPEWCYRVSRGVVVAVAVTLYLSPFTLHRLYAQPAPAFIAKQGQVRVGGQPANGEKSIVFRVYDAPSSGTKVWERNCTVYCINGMFNYPLSTDNSGTKSIADLDFTTTQYYMAMSLDGGANELMPREPIAAIPYAFAASTATCLRGNGHIKITGGGDHYIANGNVGIGILSPTAKLDVQGAGGVNVQYGVNASTMVLTGTGIYGLKVSSGVLLATSGGSVGIGTVSPGSGIDTAQYDTRLHILGSGARTAVVIENSNVNTAASLILKNSSGNTAQLQMSGSNFTVPDMASFGTINSSMTIGTDGAVGSGGTHSIYFKPGGWGITPTMTLHWNGNVGVGNSDPIAPLTIGNSAIVGSDGFIVIGKKDVTNGQRHWRVGFDSNFNFVLGDYGNNNTAGSWLSALKFAYNTPADTIVTKSNGYVGIGISNPSYKLTVNGNIYAAGLLLDGSGGVWDGVTNWRIYAYGSSYANGGSWQGSDIRLKKNIRQLTSSLEKVMNLRGVSYEWRSDEFQKMNLSKNKQIGIIAQELEKEYPELVTTGIDGYKAVAYDKLTPVLVEAIKQLKNENDELKAEIAEIRNRLDKAGR